MSCVCKELEAKQAEIDQLRSCMHHQVQWLPDDLKSIRETVITELTTELDRVTKRCAFHAAEVDRLTKHKVGQADHIRRLEKSSKEAYNLGLQHSLDAVKDAVVKLKLASIDALYISAKKESETNDKS